MPTFIDESGGTGPVLSAADRYFHLAAVWVPTLDDAQAVRDAVGGVRSRLGLSPRHEFKFSKTHHAVGQRAAFFRAALTVPFRFAVASIDKAALNWRRASAASIHWATTAELASCLRPLYLARHAEHVARGERMPPDPIWVDRNDDPTFLGMVEESFRMLGASFVPKRVLVKNARFDNSTGNEIIQLADMLCGATAAVREGGREEWFELVRRRYVGCEYPSHETE